MKLARFSTMRCGMVLVLAAALAGCMEPARTALDDYVAKPDPSYGWWVKKTVKGEGCTTHILHLKSQTWRTKAQVDRTVWEHWLLIVQPDKVKHETGMLFIGGGDNDGDPPEKASEFLPKFAVATSSVVAELRMIPNQPLRFADSKDKARHEDDLVAYTWAKFLETEDPTWLARFPMVKGAVKAMDAMGEFLAMQQARPVKVDKFVVAGGSKRGWTTWLTGAVDKRVVAIIPAVIDVVNMRPSMIHHYEAYGFWAPAVHDYVEHKIMEKQDWPAYDKMVALVDPYSYRNRLTLPKFIVNSSGDQFFLPDSSQFYYDDLRGEKLLRYVPNSDHSLRDTDAIESIGLFYNAILAGRPRPKISWKADREKGTIRVHPRPKPKQVNLWQATNPDARDFRLEKIGKAWTSSPLAEQGWGAYVAKVDPPKKGWTAFFIEMVYDAGADVPFKCTTEVVVVPDVLPFKGKLVTAPPPTGK